MKTIKTMLKHQKHVTNRGLTLIEVMIAVVVFSVGMMAVLMLQFSAIDAYSTSRDVTQGADVAARLNAMLRIEIEQSRQSNANTAVYQVNSPFDATNLQDSIVNNAWQWQIATPEPVDERLLPRQGTSGAPGRYCAYIRGDFIQDNLGGLDNTGNPVSNDSDLRVHSAVVFPAANREMRTATTCTSVFADFGCAGGIAVLLDPSSQPVLPDFNVNPNHLENCGLRVIYTSSVINLQQ